MEPPPQSCMALRKLAQSISAIVAIFPSDHYFSDDLRLMRHVEMAARAAWQMPSNLVLLGVFPDRPDISYGLIEPDTIVQSIESVPIYSVRSFWEKHLYKSRSIFIAAEPWEYPRDCCAAAGAERAAPKCRTRHAVRVPQDLLVNEYRRGGRFDRESLPVSTSSDFSRDILGNPPRILLP